MKPTVLSVDDSPDDAILMKRAHRRAEVTFELQFAGDGQEAIHYLEGQGTFSDRGRHPLPSLVLLDLKMPNRNGFDVLSWVRAQPGLAPLKIAVFTSSDNAADIDRAYRTGADWYLVKPVDQNELIRLLRSVESYLQRGSAETIHSSPGFCPPPAS